MAGSNRRRRPRRAVTHLDAVATHDGVITSKLRVLDVSQSGARLELLEGELPDTFTLTMSRRGGPRRQCRVVWRLDQLFGVSFDA